MKEFVDSAASLHERPVIPGPDQPRDRVALLLQRQLDLVPMLDPIRVILTGSAPLEKVFTLKGLDTSLG